MALPETLPTSKQAVWALLKEYLESDPQDAMIVNVLLNLFNQL